jgi:hypothetical protein
MKTLFFLLFLLHHMYSYSLVPRYRLWLSERAAMSSQQLFSLDEQTPMETATEPRTITEEISDIVDFYIEKSRISSLSTINPTILSENAHLLTQSRYYEDVMQRKLAICTDPDEVRSLEALNAFLLGFINSERRNRSRLKVSYILSAIMTQPPRIDEAMDLLSESGEIDSHLLTYLDSLVEKQMKKSLGMVIASEEDVSEEELSGIGKVTVKTLRTIQKRLRVEYETKGKPEVKVLAKLLAEGDPEVSSPIAAS